MDDASLDEFVDGDETAPETDDRPDDSGATAVQPAAVTARWVAGGTSCDACGQSVERVWRSNDGSDGTDHDGWVCQSCKEW